MKKEEGKETEKQESWGTGRRRWWWADRMQRQQANDSQWKDNLALRLHLFASSTHPKQILYQGLKKTHTTADTSVLHDAKRPLWQTLTWNKASAKLSTRAKCIQKSSLVFLWKLYLDRMTSAINGAAAEISPSTGTSKEKALAERR